jgi:hypothetical protein
LLTDASHFEGAITVARGPGASRLADDTISVWNSGAVLLGSHGTPSVAEVFAFLAGALTGIGVLALAAH